MALREKVIELWNSRINKDITQPDIRTVGREKAFNFDKRQAELLGLLENSGIPLDKLGSLQDLFPGEPNFALYVTALAGDVGRLASEYKLENPELRARRLGSFNNQYSLIGTGTLQLELTGWQAAQKKTVVLRLPFIIKRYPASDTIAAEATAYEVLPKVGIEPAANLLAIGGYAAFMERIPYARMDKFTGEVRQLSGKFPNAAAKFMYALRHEQLRVVAAMQHSLQSYATKEPLFSMKQFETEIDASESSIDTIVHGLEKARRTEGLLKDAKYAPMVDPSSANAWVDTKKFLSELGAESIEQVLKNLSRGEIDPSDVAAALRGNIRPSDFKRTSQLYPELDNAIEVYLNTALGYSVGGLIRTAAGFTQMKGNISRRMARGFHPLDDTPIEQQLFRQYEPGSREVVEGYQLPSAHETEQILTLASIRLARWQNKLEKNPKLGSQMAGARDYQRITAFKAEVDNYLAAMKAAPVTDSKGELVQLGRRFAA